MNAPTPIRSAPHAPAPAGRGGARRGAVAAAWLLPSAALLLMPKCPMCVAAYVAMFTGLSLSFSAASALQTGLIIASAAALGVLVLLQFRRWLVLRSAGKVQPDCCCVRRPLPRFRDLR